MSGGVGAAGISANDCLKLLNQRRKIIDNYVPKHSKVHSIIEAGQTVTHTYNLTPGNVWMFLLRLLGDTPRCFAHDFH